jgi:hypothetical protein
VSKLGLAFKAFFKTMGDPDFAERLLSGAGAEAPKPAQVEAPKASPAPAAPTRSEALTLLAALQREARLIDFLMEPIDAYSDEQVGGAVRDIQKDSRATLERMFGLEPLRSDAEGASVEVPAGFDPAAFKLSGNVSGEAPYNGSLVHAGWNATRCDLPAWTGQEASMQIVAPAEVEV